MLVDGPPGSLPYRAAKLVSEVEDFIETTTAKIAKIKKSLNDCNEGFDSIIEP